jgi:hypothetical protein
VKNGKQVIYISGAISGTDDYIERFKRAEEHFKFMEWAVINPAEVLNPLKDVLDYETMMDINFKLLDYADAIYMLKGWEQSRGANREFGFALGSCKEIIYQTDNDINYQKQEAAT